MDSIFLSENLNDMNALRRIFRFCTTLLHVFVECLTALVVVYGLLVVFGQSFTTGSLSRNEELYIYVKSNGVHTDICMPAETELCCWTSFVPLEDYPDVSNFDFFTVGWGDKGFFLDTPEWSDLTVSTAVNAAFLPSSTAMHVDYGVEPEESAYCRKVYITKDQFIRIEKYIKASFLQSENGVLLIQGKGYGTSDNFYEARGSYHLFNTCNTWVNHALKEAGINTSVFAALPDGIMNHLEYE